MSNESTAHHDDPEGLEATRSSARAVAFERLIDQMAPGRGHVPPEMRAARRLCGRWLLLRRCARRLSRAEVTTRVGLSEGALELLEQGLIDPTSGPEEGWLRLALVLERHGDNDLPRVRSAIATARGRAEALDAALLVALDQEVAAGEEEQAPARTPQTETDQELIDILAAVTSVGATATAYQIKKAIAAAGGKSWNPADLPGTMAALVRDGLVSRLEGRPASYALTEVGAEVLVLAEQRRRASLTEIHARAERQQAQAAIALRLRLRTGEA